MPYFRRDRHKVVPGPTFLDFVVDQLPQAVFRDVPILTGEEIHEAAIVKKASAGGLDRWAWMEIKTLSTCSSSSADCVPWTVATGPS